jgi:uncharacterized protein YecT (DUF1311 family)
MQQGLKVFRRESLEAVLNQKERAKLKAADLAYERYIQAQCELEASPVFGGSMYAGELQTCLYRLREQRVADYPRMHQNFSSWRNQ